MEQITSSLEGAWLVKSSETRRMRHYPDCRDFFYAVLYRNNSLWEVVLVYNSFVPKPAHRKTPDMLDYDAVANRGVDEHPYWAIVKAWDQHSGPYDFSVDQICGLLGVTPEESQSETRRFQIPQV